MRPCSFSQRWHSFFLGLDGGLLFLYPLFGCCIFSQLVFETGNGITKFFEGFFIVFELRLQLLKRFIGELFGDLRGQTRLPVFLFGFELSPRIIEFLGPGR